MILISSHTSVRNQQVSVLACLETVLATGLIFSMLFWLHMTYHIVVSLIFAPFLLTRTPRSIDLNINASIVSAILVANVVDWVKPKEAGMYAPVFWVFLTVLSIPAFFLTRVTVFARSLLAHPIEAISYIPENWRKVVLCTDTGTLPELIPGLADLPLTDRRNALRLYGLEFWFEEWPSSWYVRFWLVLAALPIFVAAMVYRWSLKSTALIWSPLVWAFRPIRREDDPTTFSKAIIELSLFKFSRLYSAIVLVLFAAKIWIWFYLTHLGTILHTLLGGSWDVLSMYLVPDAIPLWHVTAATNALLTWGIYFRAERYAFDAEHRVENEDQHIATFFKSAFVTRNVLTIYTAMCTVYITIRLVSQLDMPRFELILFPLR
jgi:hypothetical protein